MTILKADFISSLFMSSFFILTGLIFALRVYSKGKYHDARAEKPDGIFMIKGITYPVWWAMGFIAKFYIKAGLSANIITWFSLYFSGFAAILFAVGHFGLGGLFMVLAFFHDILDGMVARMTEQVSDYGALLDTMMDRYVEYFVFMGLCLCYRNNLIGVILCITALQGSFTVTYMSSLSKTYGIETHGIMKRGSRAVCLITGAVLSPFSQAWLENEKLSGTLPAYPMIISLAMLAILCNISAIKTFLTIKTFLVIENISQNEIT
jgi:CDP-diacylglycerol--glycerol-3-phosphate 3-phosphatidyltransferase